MNIAKVEINYGTLNKIIREEVREQVIENINPIIRDIVSEKIMNLSHKDVGDLVWKYLEQSINKKAHSYIHKFLERNNRELNKKIELLFSYQMEKKLEEVVKSIKNSL